MNLWDISENIDIYTLWKIDGNSPKNIKLEIATLGYANPMEIVNFISMTCRVETVTTNMTFFLISLVKA